MLAELTRKESEMRCFLQFCFWGGPVVLRNLSLKLETQHSINGATAATLALHTFSFMTHERHLSLGPNVLFKCESADSFSLQITLLSMLPHLRLTLSWLKLSCPNFMCSSCGCAGGLTRTLALVQDVHCSGLFSSCSLSCTRN